MDALFNSFLFNPVFWHIWDGLQNPKIRKLMVRGGSSAGKTAGFCDALNLAQLPRVLNTFALRKHRVHVDTTIKPSFETSIKRLEGLGKYFDTLEGEIRVATGSTTVYSGLDDPEKVKGLESFDVVYLNELNQFEPEEYEEINRRLRGRPNQKICADWNPISKTHWINTEILGEDQGWRDLPLNLPEYEEAFGAFTQLTPGYAFKRINAAGDTLWINVTYRDNFWIVGHPACTTYDPATDTYTTQPAEDGRVYGFVDYATLNNFGEMKRKKLNSYRIYGMGEDGLTRTGNEFWKSYDEERHVRDLEYTPGPLHVTVDSNVSPYITVAIWQIIGRELRQIAELPCRSPKNTAFKSAVALSEWMAQTGHTDLVFVYGDPAANARNTVDDDGRSFFDKFIGTLQGLRWGVVNRVQKGPPAVALSGAFVNDIYDGTIKGPNGLPWSIVINTSCRTSREDYTLVKEDANGRIDKTKVPDPLDPTKKRRIEKYGHFSDAKRYFAVTVLHALFEAYKNRSRSARATAVSED